MVLDINEIMKLLPHRYPFLLVDRIDLLEPGVRIVGTKNVTVNEPFFQGHFPGHPIMPGVLIIEAMAQVGGVFAIISDKIGPDKVTYFVGIDNARFRKPVLPGDVLRMELEIINCRRGLYCFKGRAFVGETLVTEADLKATFADRNDS
ncbi:3-hydroxyacyl-[acyl-carrier-protein] dehydratase [Geoalkalibacter ferrihydriticus]|uniref:3-hydroxyacyl-[acyl-carrier-protein] dehydratase FabZ n=2 Tax=Geoalkalibacter ferrihydriticus TaxID=392333 RepID=A0A0C2HLK2_9BACT|nr:3-hydroxyacyl-ACP dehydratase FabZ [Geoalkalibacter ferrihydriticus]KIH75875.1 3-hydroxyacyl-ACP dehydratase [Geoalkalibacter ferrihydriticus DSM 17813]SDM63645.1 3-hydroxyacyl-[acyl-carrier-protein] dehydratase [Geoalkalibacter ferrihydriticus]